MPSLGIMGSPWVGFKHFQRFFDSYYFWELIKNTLGISIYSLVVGFPLPIILALALNEIKDGPFKKLPKQSRMLQTLLLWWSWLVWSLLSYLPQQGS